MKNKFINIKSRYNEKTNLKILKHKKLDLIDHSIRHFRS